MAIITGTPVSDLLLGTEGSEVLRGLEGDDAILGNSGDDQIDGGSGNDSLSGNQGNDSLFGGAGDDSLFGGQDNDLVIGEAGNDFIAGDAGTNQLTGGIGRDTFVVTSGGTSTITDFAVGDDLIGLSGDLTFDQVNLVQTFANTLVVDRRTGETLATLNNVNSSTLRPVNFVDAETRQPVEAPAVVVPLVDVTAVDPIALANNSDDPIVFVVSRTNSVGDLVVNFTLTTSNGVVIAQVPNTVRIPAGQFAANVVVPAQSTSRDGTVTFTLQDAAAYDVRAAVATGTVVAPVLPTTPAPAPAPPDAPTVVDLVLTRVDTPATPAAGENITSVFTVENRGTGQADRVVFSTTLPIDSQFVSAVPSQGTFSNFAGTSAREGNVGAELGSLAPNATATVTVVYAPRTTGNVVPTSASVTAAQPDVDPSNNFANAQFTVIPSAPVLPVVTIAAPNTAAVESNTTIQENAGAVAQNFTITRAGGNLSQPLTVNFQISGDAQNTTDFEPIGSSVTFAPFETTRTVRILPVQDRQVEDTESVTLTLVPNALTYNVGTADAATIAITDVPNPITPAPLPAVVSIVAIDQFAEEANGVLPDAQSDSPRRGVFRISRDNSVGNLEVNLEVTGNADSGDFTLSTSTTINGVSALTTIDEISTITIPDGAQFIDLIVTAVGDDLSEGFEDVIVNVAPGVGYQIGRPQDVASDNPAFVRIRDNDTPPNVSITAVDGIGSETGDSITFQVSRTGDLSGARAVVVELPRGFTIGADPDGTGPLTAPIVLDSDTAGRPRQIQRNGNFDVDGEDYDVTGDNVFLGLSTLTSDVGASVGNLNQFPPDSTSNRFLVVIPAGQSSTDITLTPINDRVTETVESVVARIVPPPLPDSASGIISPSDIPPGGFIVTGGAAEAFILDSDATQILLLQATDPTAIEGGDNAVLTLTRSGSTAQPLPVTLTTVTADFRIQPAVIQNGVPVPTQEQFNDQILPILPLPPVLTIQGGNQFQDIDLGTVTIRTTLFDDVDEITVNVQLRLGRSGDPSVPLTVSRTLIDQIATLGGTAVLGTDYDLPDGLVIPAGQSTLSVDIEALVDGLVEGTEGFAVIAGTNPGFRVIGQPAAFTIQDADQVQTLSIASTATAAEGGAPGQFTITRTGDTSTPLDVAVNLVTTGANGSTATPGTDFVPIPTRITIPAGATFVNVPVTAIDDGVPENAIETVVLTLQTQTNFVIGSNTATVGIADRTVATITVVAANPTIVEGTLPDGTTEFVFTRTAIPGATTPATQFPARTVNFILSGTAQNGIDFLPLSGQVSFVQGAAVATIDLSVIADALPEPNQTVIITLEPESVALAGYVIVGTQAVVTISDVPIDGGGGQPGGGGIGGNDILGTPNNDNIGTISTNGVIGRPLGSTVEQTAEFNFTTPFNDSVVGGTGSDTVNGGAGDDTINGGEGDDSVVGGDGNDSLVGGANSPLGDTLVGGLGSDVFVVDDVADVIVELANQGTDAIQASIDFTLPNNVENLTLLTGATSGNGNTQNNLIVGNTVANLLSGDDGTDTILGGSGNDTINGGTGNDSLSGGPGADTFAYRFLFDGLDQITDFSGTGGDRILLETSGGTFLPQNFATTGAESGNNNFTNVVDVLTAGAAGTNIFSADLIRIFSTTIPNATALDAFLAAQLGAGATDSVVVYFDGTNVRLAYDRNPSNNGNGSVINENGAVDLAVFENLTNIASVSTFLLGAQGNVVLGEAPAGFVPNQSPDSLVGDNNSNLLQGFGGNDTLVGLGGNDTLDAGADDDIVFGGQSDDSLVGGSGRDILFGESFITENGLDFIDGGSGIDLMIGGNDSDIFIFDTDAETAIGGFVDPNFVTRDANSGAFIIGSLTFNNALIATLTPGTEILISGNDGYLGDGSPFSFIDEARTSINLSLNNPLNFPALDVENLTLIEGSPALTGEGNADPNVITGNSNNNVLSGLDGSDRLIGNAGNDILDGGTGADILEGGAGDDTLVVGEGGIGDQVFGGEGTDLILSFISLSLASFPDVENISAAPGLVDPIELSGNAGDNIITGGPNDDTLNGGGGADTLNGLAGDDELNGGTGNDELNGAGGADILNGGDGGDTLSGGADGDSLEGGADGDQLNGGDGNDTLGGGDGSDTLNGGNGVDILNGGADGDQINGDADGDQINGNAGDDTIDGGSENDSINGGADNDQISGSAGGDTLSGDNGNDQLDGGEGDDSLTGGAGEDTLTGGAGNDNLTGGAGPDNLTGGDGNDIFTISSGEGPDTITDFQTGSDNLEVSGFGAPNAANFTSVGNEAGIPDNIDIRFLFLQDTQRLFFTPTGTDNGADPGAIPGNAQLIVTIQGAPLFGLGDFL